METPFNEIVIVALSWFREWSKFPVAVQAARQFFSNDFRGAIESYDKVIEIEPRNLVALQGRSFCKTLLLPEITLEEALEFYTIDIPYDLKSAISVADECTKKIKNSLV